MKIGKLNGNIAFKRAFSEREKSEAKSLIKAAREKLFGEGQSILIVHEPCLPQAKETDIGIGHLTSKTSQSFFDYAKNYLGINAIEVLPSGEFQHKGNKSVFNPYNGSALSLGEQNIDLERLTKPINGTSLLSNDDFMQVVNANANSQKEGFANYENVLGKNSSQESALKKAFNKFMHTESIDKSEFNAFKEQNAPWLDRKALYSALKKKNGDISWYKWADQEKNLFVNVDSAKQKQIKALETEFAGDIEYYKFKQFLAEKHLQLGRKAINEKGMKLFGDCLIGFSEDEVWAFRDAFKFDKNGKTVKVGLPEWKIPALNYEKLTEDGSEAQKLLKMKVGLFARRYDGIRFDCSWSYVSPKLSDKINFEFGGSILNLIDDTVKSVKGNAFNPNDLIHEFEAAPSDFSIFDKSGKIKSYLRNRVKIITSANLDEKYGTAQIMRKLGVKPNTFIIGVGNHDHQSLRQIAEGVSDNTVNGKILHRKSGQVNILKKIFNIGEKSISSSADFAKYKFAEPLSAKNNMLFFMDLFGKSERFMTHDWQDFRTRIAFDFENAHIKAAESGFGFNIFDGLSKTYKKFGLDKKHKKLYEQLVKYANILYETPKKAVQNEAEQSVDLLKRSAGKYTKTKIAVGVLIAAGFVKAVISSAKKSMENKNLI